MIRLQIVEREGADLLRVLVAAMRSGDLRTFKVQNRGRKVTHTNESYPGWINWSHSDGVIFCDLLSPRKPESEWRLLSAFIGRLADKYKDRVQYISIQFPASYGTRTWGRPRARPRARRRR
jgi:hypothetical protein